MQAILQSIANFSPIVGYANRSDFGMNNKSKGKFANNNRRRFS